MDVGMLNKILVMDNEDDILTSVRTILQKEKYKVTCVSTGRNAINTFNTEKFDLVILDIMMPDLSGWDVFNSIRKINPKQKVIFLSVLELSPAREKEIENDSNAKYVLKPFDLPVFVRHVNSMLGSAK